MNRFIPGLLAALFVSLPSVAADPQPEIRRDAGAPQADGAVHTLRQIPEACARIEGLFTGDAAEPYRFAIVRTSPNCQPRARFVDAAKAKPTEAGGWKFNDLIRVPRASCPSQQAIVRIWRLPADNAPRLDGQGQARIYLQEAKESAGSGRSLPKVTTYAAAMTVEGEGCN